MMLEQLLVSGYEYKAPRGNNCTFHVRSLELIVKYGIDYTPDISKVQKLREFELKPKLGQCFSNSWIFMESVNEGAKTAGQSARMVYVEGMVWGFMTDAILHGWNSYGLADTRAVDWTMYIGCQWNRYIGIPFTEEEYMELKALVFPDEPRRPISLFDGRYYPIIEERVTEILATREPPALGN
jgi:hypothetical protein